MRLFTSALLIASAAGSIFAQRQQQAPQLQATNTQKLASLDGNPTLFAVLAAINAAGYDTEIDSPTNNPLRKSLRDHLATRNIPSLGALRRFVRDHHLPNAGDDLGQYISFALLSKGAPDFVPAMPNFPPPEDADRLREFPALLADFYREADVPRLWELSQPAYDAALAEYTDGISRATQTVKAYLRTPPQQTKGRFQVFIDLLGAPNQVHTRVYLEEYFVIITPSAEPRIDEVRHHYLRFWSDGFGVKYAENLGKLKFLGDFALASPILGAQYRDDFLLLATESFIRAVESRLPPRQPALATQAMREGFVLAPAFADALPKYEAQDDIMRDYFPELVKSIDPKKESVRLDKIDFVTERAVRTVRVTVPAKPPVLTGLAKALEDAEELFRGQKLTQSKEAWSAILGGTAEKPAQARAYYGLARVALSERDPERADMLFRKVLELEPDASTHSWSLVYLGKLADSQGEAEPAKEFYGQALAIAGLPDQVKREAQQGLTGAFFKPRPPEEQQ